MVLLKNKNTRMMWEVTHITQLPAADVSALHGIHWQLQCARLGAVSFALSPGPRRPKSRFPTSSFAFSRQFTKWMLQTNNWQLEISESRNRFVCFSYFGCFWVLPIFDRLKLASCSCPSNISAGHGKRKARSTWFISPSAWKGPNGNMENRKIHHLVRSFFPLLNMFLFWISMFVYQSQTNTFQKASL